MIAELTGGYIYRNQKPHVRSIHAYFPSAALLPGGEMVATAVVGEAFEAANLQTILFRSPDGENWQMQGPILERPAGELTSNAARISAMPGGELVVFMIRHDRGKHPEEGLANPENVGFVDCELLLLRSRDGGHNWQGPFPLNPPLTGPSFEMCAPIEALSDGRWVLSTSTWHNWDGYGPSGLRQVGLVSRDRGQTWPEYLDIMHDAENRVFYWESKIVELPDGRLLSCAWAYDQVLAKDLPNQYALSVDGGKTWTPPRSMGLFGQTHTPLALPDGRVLSAYRRIDVPGLWAAVSRLEGDNLVVEEQAPLWGANDAGLTSHSENMASNFAVLKFGAPHMLRLPDGSIHLVFWAVEDGVGVARWLKFRLG
ncbi:MAG: sialidase family protein [Armatimonadota bacterium]